MMPTSRGGEGDAGCTGDLVRAGTVRGGLAEGVDSPRLDEAAIMTLPPGRYMGFSVTMTREQVTEAFTVHYQRAPAAVMRTGGAWLAGPIDEVEEGMPNE